MRSRETEKHLLRRSKCAAILGSDRLIVRGSPNLWKATAPVEIRQELGSGDDGNGPETQRGPRRLATYIDTVFAADKVNMPDSLVLRYQLKWPASQWRNYSRETGHTNHPEDPQPLGALALHLGTDSGSIVRLTAVKNPGGLFTGPEAEYLNGVFSGSPVLLPGVLTLHLRSMTSYDRARFESPRPKGSQTLRRRYVIGARAATVSGKRTSENYRYEMK